MMGLSPIILFLIAFATGDDVANFKRSKCVQSRSGIVCDKVPTETDYEKISNWAPGQYALPMSKYGCPESRAYGWREGYISLTFSDSAGVVTYKAEAGVSDQDPIISDLEMIHTNWPYLKTFVLGPFNSKLFKLNFCYKYRHNVALNTGSWPSNNYSLYSVGGCPEGFTETNKTVRLPELESWTTNGFIPDFSIQEHEGYAILKLALCSRETYIMAAVANESSVITKTPFIFLRNRDSDCPVLNNGSDFFEEETLFLGSRSKISSHTIFEIFESYCYFLPYNMTTVNIIESVNTYEENAYIWSSATMFTGRTKLSELNSVPAYTSNNLSGTGTNDAEYQDESIVWKLLDLGRTVTVSEIRLYLQPPKPRLHRKNLEFIFHPSNQSIPLCMISNGLWDFLHFDAVSCPTIPYFLEDEDIFVLKFLREVDGRFVALVGHPGERYMETVIRIDVITKRISYYSGYTCNIDLGMKDGTIKDVQISASSSKHNYLAESARPYKEGWCADIREKYPFIMVDLEAAAEIDGVTFWRDESAITGKSCISCPLTIEILYSKEKHNPFTTYGTNFHFDASWPLHEQQSFWFLKPFTARYIKLRLAQPFEVGFSCLRFELHGCRQTEGYNLTPSIYQFHPFETVISFVQIISTAQVISSIGFPKFYPSGQEYKWIIRFAEKDYVKVIFTSISLSAYQVDTRNQCNDSILLSNQLLGKTQTIDHKFNSETFLIETSQEQIVLSFVACLPSSKRLLDDAHGFEAVITSHSDLVCFSLGEPLLNNNRKEVCTKPSMVLKSMSFLGLTFVGTVELWVLHFPRRRIRLLIMEFYVAYNIGSEFKIFQATYERTYCSLNRPPDTIESQSDNINVTFYRGERRPSEVSYTEGFKLIYNIMNTSYEHLIEYETRHTKVKDVAFGKPAVIKGSHVTSNKFNPVENATARLRNDGIIGCFDIGFREMSPDYWWIVDLQDTYILKYIAMFYDEQTREDVVRTIEISTGIYAENIPMTSFHCGKPKRWETIYQHDIHARFVKIKDVLSLVDQSPDPFSAEYLMQLILCEVEIYGILDRKVDEHRRKFYIDRTKEKIDQLEIDHLYSHFRSYKCPSQKSGEFGSWSLWSDCSEKCGPGSRQRTRVCKRPPCLLEDTEYKICEGNTSCPVWHCSVSFKKCYSIFYLLSNWKLARQECSRRNLTLVSINSVEEMRFIKYLFREKRFIGDSPSLQPISQRYGARYYSHIGLHLKYTNFGTKNYIWEKGFPALFSAWKGGEPSIGSCVRMNYQYFDPDNTWESEDCSITLADSFVCETDVMDLEMLSVATVLHLKYQEHTRYSSKTITGKTCQAWRVQTPHFQRSYDEDFPEETLLSVQNYCRDPFREGYLWCYTMDVKTRTEPCIVDVGPSYECSDVFSRYNGKQNTTVSGKVCERWENYKHVLSVDHSFISNAENYCRDPNENGFVWCFIRENEWEPCSIATEDTQGKDISINIANGITNGKIIPFDSKCNRLVDDEDLSDETDCSRSYTLNELIPLPTTESHLPATVEKTSYFMCGTKEYVSIIAVCDRVVDCIDASDEMHCLSRCSPNEFRCDDGDCIHISQVCDFTVDCIDESDEFCRRKACLRTEFECSNGQCIDTENRCDGLVNCLDGTDEQNCDVCNHEDLFNCDSVKCIPRRLLCDGLADCDDKTDESSCVPPSFQTCEQWLDAGYRKSGAYNIDGLDIACNFNLQSGTVTTVFKNRDYLYDKSMLYYGNENGLLDSFTVQTAQNKLTNMILDNKYRCSMWFTETCAPVHAALLDFDVSYYSGSFNMCLCNAAYMYYDNFTFPCKENRCMNPYTSMLTCDAGFVETLFLDLFWTSWMNEFYSDSKYWQAIQINMGPFECTRDYTPHNDDLACEGDVKVIGNTLRCFYNVDALGYALGCRSKSHLQHCESFKCAEGLVKCPRSYCIPIKFVCDGDIQCPGGEDETNCGCKGNDNEIIILVDYTSLNEGDVSLEKFAGQFASNRSIVRVLNYEVDHPLQSFKIEIPRLHIEDIVHEFKTVEGNRNKECRYKILADRLLEHLKFTDKEVKAVIFLQTGSHARLVADALFGNSSITLKSFQSGIHLYRLIEDPFGKLQRPNEYQFVTDIYIPRWKTLTDIGAEFFPKLCRVSSKVHCPGMYKCTSSKMCISFDNLCDGVINCIQGDDERLCNFKCPDICICAAYSVNCHNTEFSIDRVDQLPVNVRQLDLSMNIALKTVLQNSYLDLKSLVRLNLSYCDIDTISTKVFRTINNLRTLDLRFNMIQKISSGTFSSLTLEFLYLSHNYIEVIEDFTFNDLSVKTINIEFNRISTFSENVFTGVRDLEELRTPAFKFCCIRPNYLRENDCYPSKDEFSSCEDLMRLSALQTMLWLVGLSAFFGNILSLVYRLKYNTEKLKLGFGIFVTHLAVSDLLMGVYLMIIAVADAVYRKRYIFNDDNWRNSGWCNLAGVLSTLSSEASVLFLCLITLDRLFVIKYPFGKVRFDQKTANLSACVVWSLSLVFAILPVVYESYFQSRFYSRSGVCIALPLTRDRPPGWMYSVTIFVGFNFLSFLMITYGQWSIFMEVKKSSSRVKKMKSTRKNDLIVARNLLLIVATDFLCWFPVGVMGMMALNGFVISGDIYAWTAVFILPINSALNPVLYTLTAILGKTKFNPDTDEQNRTQLTEDFGNYFKDCRQVNKYIYSCAEPKPKYKSVGFVLENEILIPVPALLKLSARLAKVLDVIHRGSLVMGNLSKNTVYLRLSDNQITGEMIVTCEPHTSKRSANLSNDMLATGILINCLLRKVIAKDPKQIH